MRDKKKSSKKRTDGAELMMRILARSGAFNIRPSRWLFGKDRKQEIKVKINSVVSRCAGETHFWCDSNVGMIRKPVGSIPKNLLRGVQNQRTGRFVYA